MVLLCSQVLEIEIETSEAPPIPYDFHRSEDVGGHSWHFYPILAKRNRSRPHDFIGF
jgi:hypothetical protein